jgi:predicted hydrolase (HD superfamily)
MPKELVEDIKSHAYFITGIEPKTNLQKYLASVDELVGFINAYSLMRPN